ncbi:copper amine oxidase N-terminal domain-containing protein [Paenibacillus amylolyticus]|uniref:copper amine oxidase N-terminal domain-containing protein n=1 Tax=Paenibacillus amylolyticus TaxID=1451 RepID=UPI0039B029DF
MKKLILTLLAGILTVSLMGSGTESVAAASTPKQVEVLLNTVKMKFPDAKPFQDSQGSVMVPIRFVSEALGAKVTYAKTGKVSHVGIVGKDHKVDMTIGQTKALVDGQKKDYGTQIILKQNRTFVPLRLVSEGLGQKVEWDKIGRWVWIGNKDFRSTDDKDFKLKSLSDFKAYEKSNYVFNNIKDEKFNGIKVIKESDLPLRLANGQVIYSLELVKRSAGNYIEIRSSQRGTTIQLLVKNEFAKVRSHVENAFVNNNDQTGLNYYPENSSTDKFQNRKYIDGYDYTKFKFRQADYILFSAAELEDYGVAIVNPFK